MNRTMSITLTALALLAAGLSAQDAMWAPKGKPGVYAAPNKPHTKLADLLAKHKGAADWRETIVSDEHLRSDYVQMKPGAKTPKMLHPDTRAWWVVMDGQVRFEIEDEQPVTAGKGSMMQVPFARYFSLEAIGDKPALLFETNIANAKTLYGKDIAPPAIPGFDWAPVNFRRDKGVYDKGNKPHVTFEEQAALVDSGKARGTQRIVEDVRGAANFIYGYEKNLPPINPADKGHYHPECAEYWLIMKGHIRYPIETVGVVIAAEGDVVYVPKYTFHAPRWYGEGASCRLAMNGYPYIAHLFEGKK